MKKIFGYCRISTAKQNIERQVRNILAVYPEAIIRKEVYTGTKYQGRDQLLRILKSVQAGDTIVFDSVSRMSRNADEGVQLYFELYQKGINLVFLKESYINTDTYKSTLQNQVQMTGDDVDIILNAVNEYLKKLAEKQIRIAFDQSEKEVMDIRQRTKEGIETARRSGKLIGGATAKGKTRHSKKYERLKDVIISCSKSFDGKMDNKTIMEKFNISEPTLLKYKRMIRTELEAAEA